MPRHRLSWISLFALFLLLLSSLAAWAGAFAPPNPAFVAYVEDQARATSEGTARTEGGRTPSPVDLSHLAGKSLFTSAGDKGAWFPATFDLRKSGLSSPVRDQAPYGSCWTFSAMASLESTALRAGIASPDYAEMHLGYFGCVDRSPELPGFKDVAATLPLQTLMDQGGDDFRATALLARGTGAVDETEAPYEEIPDGAAPLSRRLETVYNFYYDSGTRYQKASVENIKRAVAFYGAASVGVYASDPQTGNWNLSPYFNSATSAAFIPAGNPDGLTVGWANHAVTVVGWDDTYSRENFNALNRPEGDGAWIVKNSWGDSWGDGGYFYLSYEDAALDTGAVYIGTTVDAFERIYQHDPLGWVTSYSPAADGGERAWMANVFTAAEEGRIESVAFYAGGVDNVAYISVHTGVEAGAPRSGLCVIDSQGATLEAPGYHTIHLDEPVDVAAGTTFSIVVDLTTPGYDYPVAVENRSRGYSDKATAARGESFVSVDGTTWTDLTDVDATANVCLKAFADGPVGHLPKPTLLSPETDADDVSLTPSFSWQAVSSDEGAVVYDVLIGGFPIAQGLTTTTLAWPSGQEPLRGHTIYRWWVTARVENKPELDTKSDARNFTTLNALPSVRNDAPADGALNVAAEPTFSWTADDGDGDSLSFVLYLTDESGRILSADAGTGAAHSWTEPLDAGAIYLWQVSADDGWGGSALSERTSFRVALDPVASGDIDFKNPSFEGGKIVIPDGGLTLTWQPPKGLGAGETVSYVVTVRDAEGTVVFRGETTATELFLKGLVGHGTYTVTVDAVVENVGTVTGTPKVFETANRPPVEASRAPADGAVDIPANGRLSWRYDDPDGDALTYVLYLGTEEALTDDDIVPLSADATGYALSNADGRRFWKLAVDDGFGGVVASSVRTFIADGGLRQIGELSPASGDLFSIAGLVIVSTDLSGAEGPAGIDVTTLRQPSAIDNLKVASADIDDEKLTQGLRQGTGEAGKATSVGTPFGLSFEADADIALVPLTIRIDRDALPFDAVSADLLDHLRFVKVLDDDLAFDLVTLAGADRNRFFSVAEEAESFSVSFRLALLDRALPADRSSAVQTLTVDGKGYFLVHDGAEDGIFTDPLVPVHFEAAATGGSSGGCALGAAPAALLLLLPALLSRRGK
ncbi:SYNERG-CTERM sorting domain-containing protein [Aminithiophilus ramosus]|uniref:SYNERG-CTERM sorting domain-containing protein n=1 Tax=Aminithiophilus ramosus TaxID=3029084 RepID=A0A9Q7APG4_9BACT|nr:lectin like domain-containing protein [Aminithiophilus ramosus]QTX32507.1 SYNERG-CTERM sorting domain-containing protein [Aminithiophilus ramosus]